MKVQEADDQAKKAQQGRAKKYGIGIKPGGNVTKPAQYADVPDEMFADPVNYRYPLSPAVRAINAITRFNDTANKAKGGYTDEEWAKMGARIARANKGKKYEGGKVVDVAKEGNQGRSREAKLNGKMSFGDYESMIRDAFEAKFCRTVTGEYIHNIWVKDTYDDHVVATFDGKFYSIGYTVDAARNVTFDANEKWTPVVQDKNYIPVVEGLRIVAAKKQKEGEPEGREWEVVIIGAEDDSDVITEGKESYIKSKNGRLYKLAALEESTPLWDGIKVYDNHLTDEEMAAKQGMRSVVQEWVGVIVQPAWDTAKKAVTGVLKVVDDALRSKLVNAEKAGVLGSIGLSIDALGEGKEATIGGTATTVVEKISKALSVDVVADPAAGGRLARMIAGTSPLAGLNPQQNLKGDVEMNEEELKKLIQDTISATMGGINDRIAALEARQPSADDDGAGDDQSNDNAGAGDPAPEPVPAAVTEAIRKSEQHLQEMEQRMKLSECTHMLGLKLENSGLPESFREIVAKQFRNRVFEEKDLDEAIKEQREALAALSESGQVILPEGGRISVSPLTEGDRYELAFLRLVAGPTRFNELVENEKLVKEYDIKAVQRFIEAKKPALPRALRLSEWYYSFTEDYDAIGVMRNKRMLEANILSTTVASIVKNTVNLLMAADYSVKEQWWGPVVRQEDVDTLDTATLVRAFGISTLSTIAEGDPYVETDWEDEEETATWVKRGNYIGVSLETFLLDKLNVLRSLPVRLSNAWYNTVSALVSAVFTVNTATGPVLADTGALFNSTAVSSAGGHANLGTSGLSYATFIAARTAMMKQTDQPSGAGRRLNIRPKFLLVPVDLLATAEQIRNSELVPSQVGGGETTGEGTEYQTKNSVQGQFEIIPVPDWTDTDNWAAVADPVQFPAIWLIWLRGRRTPELFSAEDERQGAVFTNDEIRFKVRQYGFRFSSSYDCAPVSDFRPLYKANV